MKILDTKTETTFTIQLNLTEMDCLYHALQEMVNLGKDDQLKIGRSSELQDLYCNLRDQIREATRLT